MFKKMILAAMLLAATFIVKAQDSQASANHHDVALQVNPLIRQILNFGNAPNVDNPYLLKYSYRFAGSNSGVGAGLGLSTSSFEDDEGRSSNQLNLDMRVGYEWYFSVGKRFELSIGPDFVFGQQQINTVSIQSFDFGSGTDSTVTTTDTRSVIYGGGARLNFSFKITDRILIGTESTYYFRKGDFKSKNKIQNWNVNFGSETYSEDVQESESSQSQSNLRLPVALFLVFRF